MAEHPSRPFYGEYALSFDLLIDRPVSQDSAAIALDEGRTRVCSPRVGFGSVAYFGAYDPTARAGATDRLVAVAQLSD